MFTVLCRHAQSYWHITESLLYDIGKSNIMLTGKYIIVLNIKGKHSFKHFYSIHIVEKYLTKRESTHANVQSFPSNEGEGIEEQKVMNILMTRGQIKNVCRISVSGECSFLIHQHLEVLESHSLLQLDILPIEPSRFNFTDET